MNLKNRPRRIGNRYITRHKRGPRPQPHAHRRVRDVFEIRYRIMPPIENILRIPQPKKLRRQNPSPSSSWYPQCQERSAERAQRNPRVEQSAVPKGPVSFNIQVPGTNSPQRHPINHRMGASVDYSAGRLGKALGCELHPIVIRKIAGKEPLSARFAIRTGPGKLEPRSGVGLNPAQQRRQPPTGGA